MNNRKLNNIPPHGPRPASQSGVALIIGLVLLITLTIIGIGTLSTTSLEQRMAGNMGDLNLAFNSAETAGRVFTRTIQNNFNFREQTGLPNGWWEQGAYNHAWWTNPLNTTPLSAIAVADISHVKTQPMAVIEEERFVPDTLRIGQDPTTTGTYYYRLTTRGTGISDNSQAIVQQIVAKRRN